MIVTVKNAVSGLAQTTSLFKSRSRIALTGSPLANNVVEYHTMIEWVAPNYLGPAVEFRAKYVEPIQAGLYYDSTAYERRKSLKMLGVLKEDLSPKVCNMWLYFLSLTVEFGRSIVLSEHHGVYPFRSSSTSSYY